MCRIKYCIDRISCDSFGSMNVSFSCNLNIQFEKHDLLFTFFNVSFPFVPFCMCVCVCFGSLELVEELFNRSSGRKFLHIETHTHTHTKQQKQKLGNSFGMFEMKTELQLFTQTTWYTTVRVNPIIHLFILTNKQANNEEWQ